MFRPSSWSSSGGISSSNRFFVIHFGAVDGRCHLLRLCSVGDEWMSTEHLWSDTERGKLKYMEKNVSNVISLTTNPIRTGPRIEPRPPWCVHTDINAIMYIDNGKMKLQRKFFFIWRQQVSVGKGKGKAIPLQACTGPKGSRRLRLLDFKTIGTWRW